MKNVWKRPANGSLKVNCDGALDLSSFDAGSGVVVRDCNRKVMDGCNRKFVCDFALVVETTALKDGIKFGLERKLQNVTFEIDSKVLHKMLSKEWNDMDWKVILLVADVKQMLRMTPDCKIEVVGRNVNMATDWVATQTSKGMCQSGWSRSLPFSLVEILNKNELLAPP